MFSCACKESSFFCCRIVTSFNTLSCNLERIVSSFREKISLCFRESRQSHKSESYAAMLLQYACSLRVCHSKKKDWQAERTNIIPAAKRFCVRKKTLPKQSSGNKISKVIESIRFVCFIVLLQMYSRFQKL